MFSDVWSENAALFKRLMKIHSTPSILNSGLNDFCLHHIFSYLVMYSLYFTRIIMAHWNLGLCRFGLSLDCFVLNSKLFSLVLNHNSKGVKRETRTVQM